MITKKTNIGLLFGGLSSEREISLKSGKALANALRTKGYQVQEIDVGHDIAQVLVKKSIEVAMIALHGTYGEDGTIQGLLEYLKIPYTGSGVVGSAVAMDKIISKSIFRDQGIPTPKSIFSGIGDDISVLPKLVENSIGFPCIAKPHAEGSTIGLSKVTSKEGVISAYRAAIKHSSKVLWEAYVHGKEFTVSILGDQALPVIEIVPHIGLFDYESKYTKGKTDYFCPARISDALAKEMQDVALRAFCALGAESLGRVDIMYDDQIPWVLEVNTIPGMTETSLVPKAAKAIGMSFEDVAEKILLSASLKIRSSGG